MSASGWYTDPSGRHEYRFHNGRSWTGDVADDGRRFVDPLGVPQSPAPTVGADTAATSTTTPTTGRNRLAVSALVLGILAIAFGLLPFLFVVGVVAGLLAIVFGVVGLRRSAHSGARRSFAVAGIVTGVGGLVAAVGGALLTVALIDAVDRFEDPGAHDVRTVGCEQDGEAWRATGRLTNLEPDERSYTISVDFVRAGTDNPQTRVRVELDDVAGGESREFSVRRVVDLDDVECIVSEVDGPPPFGIDIGG